MKYLVALMAVLLLVSGCATGPESPEYALVIHGGAGTIVKENMTPELEQEYIAVLDEALEAGRTVLENGGASLDAVESAIRVMENSPLFNAGRGSVFNERGENEMDASIMDGRDLNAGSVANVHRVRNPISLARLVMEESRHVMLISHGAEKFAGEHGLELVDSSYFFVQSRWDSFLRAQAAEKNGTVGAVALDKQGNIAAGTSTGGMTNKMWGRVGDSPIIGAGTYADNETCGVSSTGHGEFFIRNVVAYQISALMKYRSYTLGRACEELISQRLKNLGASGGVVALDKDGNIAMEFNTPGMYRGFVRSDGQKEIHLYR